MTILTAKIIFLFCVLAWVIIRIPHEAANRRKKQVVDSRSNRRERRLLAISLTGLGIIPLAYVFTSLGHVGNRPFIAALAWIGTALFVAALMLFLATHRQLGRNWSQTLELREGHTLVTHGVYHYVRHPMYTAFWLWAVAQAFLLPNWIAGFSGLIGFGILFFGRIRQEEAMMQDAFGADYEAYKARTWKVLPFVY